MVGGRVGVMLGGERGAGFMRKSHISTTLCSCVSHYHQRQVVTGEEFSCGGRRWWECSNGSALCVPTLLMLAAAGDAVSARVMSLELEIP